MKAITVSGRMFEVAEWVKHEWTTSLIAYWVWWADVVSACLVLAIPPLTWQQHEEQRSLQRSRGSVTVSQGQSQTWPDLTLHAQAKSVVNGGTHTHWWLLRPTNIDTSQLNVTQKKTPISFLNSLNNKIFFSIHCQHWPVRGLRGLSVTRVRVVTGLEIDLITNVWEAPISAECVGIIHIVSRTLCSTLYCLLELNVSVLVGWTCGKLAGQAELCGWDGCMC